MSRCVVVGAKRQTVADVLRGSTLKSDGDRIFHCCSEPLQALCAQNPRGVPGLSDRGFLDNPTTGVGGDDHHGVGRSCCGE